MKAQAADKALTDTKIQEVFREMAKFGPYVPVSTPQEPQPLPPLRDPETGALLSRFRYSNSSAFAVESL